MYRTEQKEIARLKFKLYASCIPVEGARRSLICDTQRGDYELIPNVLFDILNENSAFTLDEIVDKYGNEHRNTIEEYIQFLEKKEMGFWTDTPDQFPSIKLDWLHSSEISNAIIDWDRNSNHDYEKIFKELDELNCEQVQLRFFDFIHPEKLIKILECTDGSGILSVEIILKYDNNFEAEDYRPLLRRFPRITQLIIHSSPEERTFSDINVHFELIVLIYIREAIHSESHCGKIHPGYFAMNLPSFCEAQQYNTCLNKKISVDRNGEIRNCPSMKTGYGNIKTDSLLRALADPNYKKIWTLNKDQITVCRDCEFRYICTDCRAYTEDGSIHSKPAKCNYNPYKAEWTDRREKP